MSLLNRNGQEAAFAFRCGDDDLIGFLHAGDQRCDIGILALVAGGPQYRGGVGRQLVNLGRFFASEGLWVMRFDHRGMGDSAGTFGGFLAIEEDIAAAIDEFLARAPHLRGVILWGGCDAATAALINAHKHPKVICVIAGNPFVGVSGASKAGSRKHYWSRLTQVSFWRKLFKLEYRLGDYLPDFFKRRSPGKPQAGSQAPLAESDTGDPDFLPQLLEGLRDFDGKILFLMGDRFLSSDAFIALVSSSEDWRAAYGKPGYQRIDIKGADQVFSTGEAQQQMFRAASDWIHQAFPESFLFNNPDASPRRQQGG